MGAKKFLHKPVDRSELRVRLRNLLWPRESQNPQVLGARGRYAERWQGIHGTNAH